MNSLDIRIRSRGGGMRIPRSRGAVTGLVLILLGVWGALIPFVGPYINFAYTPDQEWTWTAGRGWLQVLPGVVTVVGALLLMLSGNRATAMLGTWICVVGGAWFVAGRAAAGPLGLGDVGTPVAASETKWAWLELTYFTGLGAVIVFFAALSMGRLSVRSLRDIRHADAPVTMVERQAGGVAEPATAPHAEPPAKPEPAATEAQPRRRRLATLFGRRDATSSR